MAATLRAVRPSSMPKPTMRRGVMRISSARSRGPTPGRRRQAPPPYADLEHRGVHGLTEARSSTTKETCGSRRTLRNFWLAPRLWPPMSMVPSAGFKRKPTGTLRGVPSGPIVATEHLAVEVGTFLIGECHGQPPCRHHRSLRECRCGPRPCSPAPARCLPRHSRQVVFQCDRMAAVGQPVKLSVAAHAGQAERGSCGVAARIRDRGGHAADMT